MEDRLDSIFAMQKGLADMMNLDRYPKDTEGKVSALCTAIMHEAVELQRTTNWKWWKTPTAFNEAEAREELIDIWQDRKSTRLNSSHSSVSRMPSSA